MVELEFQKNPFVRDFTNLTILIYMLNLPSMYEGNCERKGTSKFQNLCLNPNIACTDK